MMHIRHAALEDATCLAAIERACFPPSEAATAAELTARLRVYPSHFWLLETEPGTVVSFINGCLTEETTIRDAMFQDASLHNAHGAWQAIFGVNTLPQYRRRGYAGQVMERVIADARKQGLRGCILTCKEALLPYYAKFGYQNCGVSASVHGGVVWYDMRLEF